MSRSLRRICAGSIALFAGVAHGQTTITKANNQNDLNLSSSWIGGSLPTPADIALWNSNVTGANSVVLGADLSWAGLRITNPGGPVTINAGNTLTLGSGGIDMSAATQNLTLNNKVVLGATQSWNVGAGRTLNATGVVDDAGAFFGLTKTGVGTLTFSNANTYSGPTAVNAGTLLLDFSATGAPVSNIVSAASALQLGGGRLTIRGASGVANKQTFTSTVFTPGTSIISVAPVSGTTLPTLELNGLTFQHGGAVRFEGPATTDGTNPVAATGIITTTTAGGGTAGLLRGTLYNGTNPSAAGYATVGLYDWASTSLPDGTAGNAPYTIIGGSQVAGFYKTTYSAGGNFDMQANTTAASNSFSDTVRFNTPTATTFTGVTNTLIGGFLITPKMGAVNAILNGPNWQVIRNTGGSTDQQEGVIWQNNTLGFFNVNVPLVDGRDANDINRFVKAGDGTAVFTGNSSYRGATYINGGNWVITANSGVGAVATGAAVNLNGGGTLFANANVALDNAGANLRLVNVLDNGGGLAASEGNTLTVNGVVSGNGALTIGVPASSANGNTAGLLPGSGPGTANPTPIMATGTVALTGANTFSGGTVIKSGRLNVTGINALGGANYGGLQIDGGTLQYAATTTSGTDLTGGRGITLLAGGGTIDTNGNTVTYASGLTGPGSLTKTGAGTLTLSAASTYSGTTILNGGTLQIAAPTGSATGSGPVIVNNGATLTGSGTLGGVVTVNAGGILDPGTGVGTLVLPGLTLATDSVLKFEFNSTPANDLIQVTGVNGLTIGGGKVNVLLEGTGSPFATAGTYNLLSFNGVVQGIGTSAFSIANPAAGFTYTFGTNNNFITLTVGTLGLVTNWNKTTGGSWSTASNWSNGVPNEIGATANFGNTLTAPATITLDGNKTTGNVSFDSASGYTIAPGTGGSLTFQRNSGSSDLKAPTGSHTISAPVVLGSNVIAEIGTGASVNISGAVSGARSLTKRGDGTLSLSGTNSYSGGTTLEAGTLGIGSASALGNAAITIPSSATLRTDANAMTVANNVGIGSGATATVDTQANDLTLSGVISDNGILRKSGSGKLTLTGTNTYTGGTVLNAGSVNINNAAALGAGAVTFAGNVTLQQTGAITLANALNLNAGTTGTIDTNGSDMVLNGNITGTTGSLTKVGAGVLTLNGTNNFANTGDALLKVNGGTVVFGTATAAPAGIGLGTAASTIVDLNGVPVAAGSLSGAGVVTDNSFLGTTTTFTVNQASNTTFAGSIDNGPLQTLALTKTGAGTLALSGNNTYTGATNAFGGNLQLDTGGVIASGPLSISTGTFTLNGGSLTVNGATNLNNSGGAVLQVISGNATLNGAITATTSATNRYLINVQGGTLSAQSLALGRTGLNFSAEPTAGATNDGLYIQGGDVNIFGALSMGTTTAANSSVSARIDGGSLTVGGPITIGLNNGGRWSVVDVNGGTFTSTDLTSGILVGGPLSGSALLLVRNGTATAERIQLSSLTGASSVLNVTGGSLYVGSGGIVQGTSSVGTTAVRFGTATVGAKDSWSSSMPVTLNGVTTFRAADAANAPHDITLSGTLSDIGSVVKTGGGTLTLSGTNTYAGATTINAGVLSVNTLANGGQASGIGASASDAPNLVLNGGTLRYTGAAATTDRSFTVGSAGATLDASGTGALKWSNANLVQFVETDAPHTITLTGTNTDSNTLAAVIGNSGTGATSLVKSGPGTWVLSGANLYSGSTTINGGLLSLANTTGSATGTGPVAVNSGGALGGTGAVAGVVTVSNGGHLAPGTNVGTLNLGGLTLSTGSVLDFEFSGTTLNDRVIVSGADGLILNGGGFNLFAEGTTSRWTTPGTYNLLQYNGTLGGSTNNLSVLNPQNGLTYTFGTSGGFVTLTIGSTAVFSNWTSSTGGSWNTATNWSSGVPNGANASASFQGSLTAPGTVTLDGNKTVGALQFSNANAYTIAQGTGGTLTFDAGSNNAQVTVLNGSHTVSAPVNLASNIAVDVNNAADTLSFNGTISGSRSLTKNAAGVLRLSGANTYSGGTTVNGGVVEIANNGALGSGGLTFNSSATLRAGAAGLAPVNAIAIGNNATATIDTGANALKLSGVISSTNATGSLTKAGTGTLTLGDANTYTGATKVNGGVLAANTLADGGVASSIGQSSSAAANLVLDGGTLRYTGTGASTDRLFTIGSNGATLDASGAGPVNFTNFDVVAFSGTNTSPVVTLTGTNKDANTLTALIGNNGTGATSLNKTGAGTWFLSGANTFSGETTISGGTLALGNPLALQRSTLNYNNQGGTLGLDGVGAVTLGGLTGSQKLELTDIFGLSVALTVGANNASTTYGGELSGFGSLTKVGTGILTLTGKSTYTGTTTIASGGGALKLLTTDALSPFTTVTVNNAGGLRLGDGVTLSSNITAAVGSNEFLDVPDAGATATVGGILRVAGGSNQFRLGISGAGATLNVTGEINTPNSGSIVFLTRGNIVFSGNALINAAPGITFGRSTQAFNVTFKDNAVANITGDSGFGGGQANPSITMTIQDNASVNFGAGLGLNSSSAATSQTTLNLNGGTLTAGSISKGSVGTTQLSTMNFNGGTLRAGASSTTFLPALAGLTANVQAGGAKIDTNGFDITIGQSLVHDSATTTDGGFTKSGIGTLTLAGNNQYNGPTRITEGSLIVSGSLSGTTAVTVSGGSLELGAANRINDTATLTLGAGGELKTSGFSEILGALALGGDATLNLGEGESILHFASSGMSLWEAGTLTIAGWSGSVNGQGKDEIFFGADANGLTASQLAQIRFVDPLGFAPGSYNAKLLSTGELVVIPEPGSVAMLLAGAGSLLLRRRRRK